MHANVSSPTVSVSASTTSADYSSVQKLYVVGSRVLPVYTAVIHVTGGEIEGITWDDGCFFCDGSDPNTCLHTSVVNGTVLTAGNFAGRSCSEPRTLCEDSPRECDLKVRHAVSLRRYCVALGLTRRPQCRCIWFGRART